ncbi:hypothetical protein I302_103291 [Kwoniella bestiolae CBS 10118]|uniref:Uncharacterized protein n=1 Tax=Kwoniella bestiolae CBS 10118 TaxID=1296100 RepID=A0A1B9G7Z4_9TREE|nr:hypothetical protein I302_01990 [Kwoniella bestiolae CBS 10118]OCF27155.1 hypothetical protein I302_01990 [Kwoniella bestiolae CBS 10118]
MSYFSDTSSTCSAVPPLTPSPSQHEPHSDNNNLYSSPTPYDLTSPPASLRNYSSALMRQMSAGLKEAMKDLKDDRGGPERKFDVEYGYDEDPIERHVRLFLTPRRTNTNSKPQGKGMPELGLLPAATVPQPTKPTHQLITKGPATEPRPSSNERDINMLTSSPNMKDQDRDALQKFRPGLIHFHRTNSSSSSSSSLNPPRPAYSRMSSTMSSGSNVSMASEASFEAVKAEDIVSMYGGFGSSSGQKEDPFEYDYSEYYNQTPGGVPGGEEGELELEVGLGRTSILSTASDMTSSTIRPDHTYTQPRLSPALPPQQQQQQRPPTLPARPSFFRKRSRVHPYETPDSSEVEEPPWLADRTMSEQMVAQAGLRCQRQRAAVGVRR